MHACYCPSSTEAERLGQGVTFNRRAIVDVALLDHWKRPKVAPKLEYGVITPELENQLPPCPTRGHFQTLARPRCCHCDEPLDTVRTADYIEQNAPGQRIGASNVRGAASTALSSKSELRTIRGSHTNAPNRAMQPTAGRFASNEGEIRK